MKHLKNMKNKSLVATLVAAMAISYITPMLTFAQEEKLSNDPLISNQWALSSENNGAINIKSAWDVTKGKEDVIVAVIGTGVDINHPDLKDRIHKNIKEIPGNKIDDDNNGYIDDTNGWDFYNKDNTMMDSRSQDLGDTRTAGIIAASSDNELGISGIAPNVKILPVKVMKHDDWSKETEIQVTQFVEAIKYAESMGATIAHISLESKAFSTSPYLYNAIKESNMLFINSAGNRYGDMGSNLLHAPAGFDLPNIISVGAIDKDGNISNKTTTSSTQVDLFAPGVDILSTIIPKQKEYVSILNETSKYKAISQAFGFEKLDEPQAIELLKNTFSKLGIDKTKKILLVDDDEHDWGKMQTLEYYTKPLDTMGYSYTTKIVGGGTNGPIFDEMKNYDLVIWMSGTDADVLTSRDQDELMKYMDNGGNVYLCGGGIYKFIDGSKLASNYLNIKYNGVEEEQRLEVKGDLNLQLKKFQYGQSEFLAPFNSNAKGILYFEGENYDNAYQSMEDSSYAAAHVSGVAALIKSAGVEDALSIKNVLLRNVTKDDRYRSKCTTGGRLDAGKALNNLDVDVNDDIPGSILKEKEVIGSLSDDLRTNVYRLSLKKGDYITLNLEVPKSSDFDIYVHGPEASTVTNRNYVITSGNDSYSNEKVSMFVPKDGNYYIEITSQDGVGDYKLSYDLIPRGEGDILLDDKSSNLSYIGKWTTLKDQGFIGDDIYGYNNTIAELNSTGYMEYKFIGSTINIVSAKGPGYGIAEVIVDGKSIGNVDLYSKSTEKQQIVFNKDLGYGDHTLEFKWTGKRNSESKPGSTKINVDAISVNTALTAPAAPEILRYEATKTESIKFVVNYNKQPMISHYNLYKSDDNGETFKLIQKKSVSVYNNELELADDFNEKPAEDKEYIYKITAVSKDNAESEPTTMKIRPQISPNRYTMENTSSSITYTGDFKVYNTKIENDGDNTTHVTTNSGDKIVIPFTGDGFQIFTDIGEANASSNARYSLKVESLDQNYTKYMSVYPEASQPSSPIDKFTVEGLDGGIKNGTITIQNLSPNAPLGFDKIVIFDSNTEKPQPTEKPKPPTNVSTAIKGKKATIIWDKSNEDSVIGYNIYRKDENSYTKLNSKLETTTTYIDSNVTSKNPVYVVTCVNNKNIESEYSTTSK